MKEFFSIFFLLSITCSFSQSFVDFSQKKLDKLDGDINNKIELDNNDNSKRATEIFIYLVDSIQLSIQKDISDSLLKKTIDLALYEELYLLTEKDLNRPRKYETKYKALLNWSKNTTDEYLFLEQNKPESFSLLQYIYPSKSVEKFLLNNLTATNMILKSFEYMSKESYSLNIAEQLIIQNPIAVRKYLSPKFDYYHLINTTKNDTALFLLNLDDKTARNSKALIFADAIFRNEVSVGKPDSLFSLENKIYYLKALIAHRINDNGIGVQSLDDELAYEALKFVRTINAMHEMHSSSIRFKSLSQFSAKELYFLLVYTQEEIFTSTFNGFFEKLLEKLKKEDISGYTLLQSANFNRFRTFIQLCANYGKLDLFFETLSTKQKKSLLVRFVSDLGKEKSPLSAAVTIADALSDINEVENQAILAETFLKGYKKNEDNFSIKLIYGLLINLFSEKINDSDEEFKSIAKQYETPSITSISNSELLGSDSVNTQIHLFYDDDDGEASFHSFLSTFKIQNWQINHFKEYLIIKSTKGKNVELYITKPKYEKTVFSTILDTLQKSNQEIDMLIHRGHSFHVSKSIEKISNSTKLVLLGSCGGYNRLLDIVHKSPSVQLISTKQIGTQAVNNPMLLFLAEKIRKGEDIKWDQSWEELTTLFSRQLSRKNSFLEYIPPHRNLGVKLVQAYNNYRFH